MSDLIIPTGLINNVRGELIGPDGKVKEVREASNLVVTVGISRAIQQVMGAAGGGAQPDPFTFVGVGTSNTAPTPGDTTLGAELTTGAGRIDGNPAFLGQIGDITVTIAKGLYTGQSFKEIGLFDALESASYNMLARVVFDSPVVKGANDIFVLYWRIVCQRP